MVLGLPRDPRLGVGAPLQGQYHSRAPGLICALGNAGAAKGPPGAWVPEAQSTAPPPPGRWWPEGEGRPTKTWLQLVAVEGGGPAEALHASAPGQPRTGAGVPRSLGREAGSGGCGESGASKYAHRAAAAWTHNTRTHNTGTPTGLTAHTHSHGDTHAPRHPRKFARPASAEAAPPRPAAG